jgi:gamma-glutamyltranspeptidase/glutathione hydrolase
MRSVASEGRILRSCAALLLLAATVGTPPAFAATPVTQLVFVSDPDGDARVLPSDVNNPGQNDDIYVMNADGSHYSALTTTAHDDTAPAPSPDGLRIAFTSSRDGNDEIYVMARDGRGQADLSNNPDGSDRNPSWSPDGARIVFASIRGGNLDLYVMKADGSALARLTLDPAGEDSPSWSPDGSRIAFAANRQRPDQWDLYTVRPDGSDIVQVTTGMQVFGRPSWSPDGRRLAFSSGVRGVPDLYAVDADGTHLVRLTRDRLLESGPAWSPDGGRIAYSAAPIEPDRLNEQIYVMRADGRDQGRLTTGPAANSEPAWLPAASPGVAAPSALTPTPHGSTSAVTGHEPIEVRTSAGVVATETPHSAAAGLSILNAGGNAVDAAVAAVFAVGVTRPDLCGIGGGGMALIRMADGRTAALDYRETAPMAITSDAYQGVGIYQQFEGHKTIGVPGTVAGLLAALDRYGRMSRSVVIAPAEDLARVGFPVSPALSDSIRRNAPRLQMFPAAAGIYLLNGKDPYPPGRVLVQADYARSLAEISRDGAAAFYRGPIARAIIADMQANAGRYPGDEALMTAADVAAYRPIRRSPLQTDYRGERVIAMPPPTGGGLFVVEALNILEGFDVRGMGAMSADRFHLMAEADKLAWADRDAYVADPSFVNVPTATLASRAYADRRRAEIDMHRAKSYGPGLGQPPTAVASPVPPAASPTPEALPSHTSHVSVIDAEGNAAAFTCTIETFFGSAVVAPGAGFLLNNELTDFTAPGTPNQPQGGKRPRSSMTPAIVLRHGKAVVVIGGAGGTWIPTGILMTLSNVIDFDMDVGQAVGAPRFNEHTCCDMELEDARVPPAVQADLRRRDHVIIDKGRYMPYPIIQIAGVDRRTGAHVAASDPRGEWGTAAQSPSRSSRARTAALIAVGLLVLIGAATWFSRRRRPTGVGGHKAGGLE